MTSAAIRQLQYSSRTLSNNEIQDRTGLSSSDLDLALSGQADVPSDAKAAIRNMYQREAYSNLRDSGLSSTQANRFKWYAPENVLTVETDMQDKAMTYAMGILSERLKDVEGPITFEEVSQMYEEAYSSVIEGLQSSKKTYEDFQNY